LKKYSRPEGVLVWTKNRIICVADVLKDAVKLTFLKGAQIDDPSNVFNTRLNSKTVRAVDYHKNDTIVESTLVAFVMVPIRLNVIKNNSGKLNRRNFIK